MFITDQKRRYHHLFGVTVLPSLPTSRAPISFQTENPRSEVPFPIGSMVSCPLAMNRWAELQPHLRQMLGDEEYETWILPLRPVTDTGRVVTLSCENSIVLDWIRDHLLNDLEAVGRSRFGREFQIRITPQSDVAPPATASSPPPPEAVPTLPLTSQFTFERFVVGPSNQFAHAAAIAVADRPGTTYNPLFIYGGSGLGKTHLLHAIAHRTFEHRPDARIFYMTTEQFTNQFISSLQTKTLDSFRETMRAVDILLLDDIQFITGKEQTQQEFFHTFNTLQSSGRQVVFTSDSRPSDIKGLEERLRTRFMQGLLTDIQPPDLETRCAILKEKARAQGWEISEEVVLFIARQVQNNVRELEGCLNRAIAFSQLRNIPLTTDAVRQALFDILPGQRETTPADIIRFVAQHYGIRVSDIKGRNNRRSIALPRQVSMYLVRELLGLSFPEIGRLFSKHHSTAMYAVENITKMRRSNPDFDATLTSFTDHFQTT